MYRLENEIKSKLYYCFKYNVRPNVDTISESHGVPDIVDYIVNQFKGDVERLYNEAEQYTEQVTKTFNCYLCDNVTIAFEVNTIGTNGVLGAFSRNLSVFNKKTNKYDVLYIICKFEKPKNGINEIIGIIAHEITHAVDNYNRISKGKENVFANAGKKGYVRNNGGMLEIEKKLKHILYHTMSCEQNAYISGIIQEIKPYLMDCDSSQKAFGCLTKSNIYSNILKMQDWVDGLKNLSDEDKMRTVKYYNKVMKTDIKDFKSCYKKILKRWVKFRNKLSTNLSKQITDIAMESEKWTYLEPANTMPLTDM